MPDTNVIELAILGFLKEQPLHGYELRARLNDLLGTAGGLSFGALYPALARLERAGLLQTDNDAGSHVGPTVPSSASLTGELAAFRTRAPQRAASRRGRKSYRITSRGEVRLLELLNDPIPRHDPTFRLQVAFCRHLSSQQRLALFRRRHAELTTRRAKHAAPESTRDTTPDRYRRALRARDVESLTDDLAWLDRLIEAERSQAQSMEEITQ